MNNLFTPFFLFAFMLIHVSHWKFFLQIFKSFIVWKLWPMLCVTIRLYITDEVFVFTSMKVVFSVFPIVGRITQTMVDFCENSQKDKEQTIRFLLFIFLCFRMAGRGIMLSACPFVCSNLQTQYFEND